MSYYVLDCCALINLYCGWGGLGELRDFGKSWSIGETALREAGHAREFDADGNFRQVVLDPAALVADGSLHSWKLYDTAEQTSFVEFALEVDDGEAEALSLALHRKRVLVTDDRPAIRLASRPGVTVPTVGTPEVLLAWTENDDERLRRLPEIVRRITILARFQPRKDSLHHAWWQGLLS